MTETLDDKLKQLISEHETKLYCGYASDDLSKQIEALFREYERTAADAIMDAQHFQSDIRTWLQALVLCIEMVGSAGTHTEKNARLRGLAELVGNALRKVSEYDYRLDCVNRRRYRPADLFINDFPVRHWKERAEDAERELKNLKLQMITSNDDKTVAEEIA